MPTEFLMPKLGLTMEEGTITAWLVADGDDVTSGDAVLRIETDKTETDVEAAGSGRLHVVGEVGATYACGDRIGWFLADGEAPPDDAVSQPAVSQPGVSRSAAAPASTPTVPAPTTVPATASPAAAHVAATLPGGRVIASPNVKRLAAERGIDIRTVRGTGPGGRIVSEDLDGVAASPAPRGAGAEMSATTRPDSAAANGPSTFAARSLADLLGIDLATVPADPVDGRITRDAVAHHVRSLLAASMHATASVTTAAAAPAPAPPPPTLPPAMQEPSKVVPLTGMRGTIAKRMHSSLTEMAQLTLFMDADLSAVMADRRQRKNDTGSAPSFTDYVIAASARALARHPRVNAQVTDDGIAWLADVHVGMAVALDEGLIVPVIQHTLQHDLASLSTESSRLANAARTSSLTLPDLEGGTFSVSTLGTFGVDGFTPVINPPNAAILGVGRLRDELGLLDGEVVAIPTMTLSLTWDHRVFDGAPAAEFCRSIVEFLAGPTVLDEPVAGR